MMIIAVGVGERIARVLPELGGLLRRPLITLERVRVCKRDGELLGAPHPLPGTDETAAAVAEADDVLLNLRTSDACGSAGAPGGGAPAAGDRRARRDRAAGDLGIPRRAIALHGDKLLQIRRRVPTVTIIVDRPDRIMNSYAIVDELTGEGGLVTSEMVPASAAIAGGTPRGRLRLARHRF